VRSGVDFEKKSRTDGLVPTDLAADRVFVFCRYFRSYACVARAGDVASLNLEAFQVLTRFKVSGSLSISGSGKGFGVEAIDVESLDRIAPESDALSLLYWPDCHALVTQFEYQSLCRTRGHRVQGSA
jgi:hypothetical protein